MKILLIGALSIALASQVFAQTEASPNQRFEILNRKTHEKLTGVCADDACATLQINYENPKAGNSPTTVGTVQVQGLNDKLVLESNIMRDKPQYFIVNKDMWSGGRDATINAVVCIATTLGMCEALNTVADLVMAPFVAAIRGISEEQYSIARRQIENALWTGHPVKVTNKQFSRIYNLMVYPAPTN